MAKPGIEPGAQLDGFAIGERVHQGGMATLWSVTHPGETPPPAADHPPLTVMVLGAVNWVVEHEPVSAIAGDPLDTNVREDRYAMALFGTFLVLLVGLLGRRVGRGRARLRGVRRARDATARARPRMRPVRRGY